MASTLCLPVAPVVLGVRGGVERGRTPATDKNGERVTVGEGRAALEESLEGGSAVGSSAHSCFDLQEDLWLQSGNHGSFWKCFKRGSLYGSMIDGISRGSLAAEQRGGEELGARLKPWEVVVV